MKMILIPKELLVISTVIIISCSTIKKNETANETYEVLRSILTYHASKSTTYTFILDVEDFTLNNFKISLEDQRRSKNKNLRITQCAEKLLINKINLHNNNLQNLKNWDSTKIDFVGLQFLQKKEVASGNLRKFSLGEIYYSKIISVSYPIFDLAKENAIVLTDITKEGKIINFLKKDKGQWNVHCVLYNSIQ